MTKLNPFNEGSAIAEAFEMAAKGTTREKIEALCKKQKITSPRIFHTLRWEKHNGVAWKYTQSDDGKVKLTNVHGTSKKKAA